MLFQTTVRTTGDPKKDLTGNIIIFSILIVPLTVKTYTRWARGEVPIEH